MGPRTRAGKNESAATMMITDRRTATKAGLWTCKVPELSGIYFFEASDPAIAKGPMIGMNLPNNIVTPHRMFQNGVASPRPSNPDPLLAAEDVNS